MYLYSFPNTICWRGNLLSILYSWLLCPRLIAHANLGSFLGSLFYGFLVPKNCFLIISVIHFGNWCFWTVALEKTLESPLDCKEIQPVHSKVNQSWIFIGRTDTEAETPIILPPDVKNWLIWKDPDAGKDWRQEYKGMTEDEVIGWHHWLNGHEFE